MLTPEPTVPHVSTGEVLGLDGSAVWGQAHAADNQVVLVAQDKDRCNLARVPLDRAGCIAVSALMLELAESLPVTIVRPAS